MYTFADLVIEGDDTIDALATLHPDASVRVRLGYSSILFSSVEQVAVLAEFLACVVDAASDTEVPEVGCTKLLDSVAPTFAPLCSFCNQPEGLIPFLRFDTSAPVTAHVGCATDHASEQAFGNAATA